MGISDCYLIWREARNKWVQYASEFETEDMADEQFTRQQSAVLSMAELPARTIDELRSKLQVFITESGFDDVDPEELTPEFQLLYSISSDLDAYVQNAELESVVPLRA